MSLDEMIKLFSRPINSGAAGQVQNRANFSEAEWQKRSEAMQREGEARARQLHSFDEHGMTEFECVMCQGRGTIAPG